MKRAHSQNVGVPCIWMRGGTSKGAYFLASDLPADVAARDDLLLRVMGSPDPRQIDGLGGGHPLTSKVAIVSPGADPSADVEYLFLQVVVDEARVTDRQNCGNLLAGVAPFAIERGLVHASAKATDVRIRMLNTGGTAVATVETPAGAPRYDGETRISGVPGSAAPVLLAFEGSEVDVFDGVTVTCIDNGMPVVVLRAKDFGIAGDESPEKLEANEDLRARLESIRLQAGAAMKLGDVTKLTVPKLSLVSKPRGAGDVCTRTFIPHRCHEAIGVLGAVSVATACALPGTPGAEVSRVMNPGAPFSCEHPTGSFEVVVDLDAATQPPKVRRAAVVRTARKLFEGVVFPRGAQA